MTETAKTKEQISNFIKRWKDRGYEKGDSQLFWIDLLHDVLGIERATDVISFENKVTLSHTSFIDAYIPSTKVLIEQKSINKDLRKPILQSDGTNLSPLEQAKRYAHELPYSMYPRWVVACNFRSFLIFDMENPQSEPFEVLLENLERDAHLLKFLTDSKETYSKASLQHEMEVSIEAGALVGKLYDALLQQYGNNVTEADLHSLNVLCVRLVFCLYAEDAGIFSKCQFAYYLQDFTPNQIRGALKDLFKVLDTPEEQRSRFLEPKLKAFPYVNGSLFREQDGEEIPPFTQETTEWLIQDASLGFDWSQISPTIFGAVFESTLNPETRRSGGMHYTSIENIHKVIDPLFMDELTEEYEGIAAQAEGKVRKKKLEDFQAKLAGLKFLDPACGSGNFLTETYVSLRRLENKVIRQLTHGQMLLGIEEANPIKVNIHQFYGIEINDFAVTVAKTALWIAEAQMMAETEKIIRFNDDYLPLKSYNNIAEGNALRMDWNSVVPAGELDYIIGNPPFVGARMKSKEQADDLLEIFGKQWKNLGNIDYVGGWYLKASQMMKENQSISTALVSTNSITQGEQVANLWKPLFDGYDIHIDFAYPTFRWDSESTLKAHVHCVIVGFSRNNAIRARRIYYENNGEETHGSASLHGNPFKECKNINAYLTDAPDVFVESRNMPICDVPKMGIGNKPIDGGFYLFTQDEKDEFVNKEPKSEKYFRRWYGAEEFINNKVRYCLWLGDCTPAELRSMPHCYQRVVAVRDFRLASSSEGTRKIAEKPTRFHVENMPSNCFLLVPRVSSEKRNYVPIGFMTPDVIASDAVQIIPDATIYHSGILTSSTHMSWMRAVCGRLEMRYRYSKDIVYNNFPWPTPTDAQKAKVEQTAQAILDARALYPDSSLADLYDDLTMPAELRKAHEANDRAVMEAYGFDSSLTESDIVSLLLKMYLNYLGEYSSEQLLVDKKLQVALREIENAEANCKKQTIHLGKAKGNSPFSSMIVDDLSYTNHPDKNAEKWIKSVLIRLAQEAVNGGDVEYMKSLLAGLKGRSTSRDAASAAVDILESQIFIIEGDKQSQVQPSAKCKSSSIKLTDEEVKILETIIEYMRKGTWEKPANTDNIIEWIETLYGKRPKQLDESDVNNANHFRAFFREGRNCTGGRLPVAVGNIIGYLKEHLYLVSSPKELSKTFFETTKSDYQNYINKGKSGNRSNTMENLIDYMDRYRRAIIK